MAAMDPAHIARALHELPTDHTQTSVAKRLRTENLVLGHRQSHACRTQSDPTKGAQCKACTAKSRSHKRFDGLVTSYCIACPKTHDEPWYAAYTAAMRCAACGIGRRVHAKHGDRTTTYCMTCAEHLDASWYVAYLAETRCTHCRTTKRATERYCHRITTCCYACAEEHDPAWHTARERQTLARRAAPTPSRWRSTAAVQHHAASRVQRCTTHNGTPLASQQRVVRRAEYEHAQTNDTANAPRSSASNAPRYTMRRGTLRA